MLQPHTVEKRRRIFSTKLKNLPIKQDKTPVPLRKREASYPQSLWKHAWWTCRDIMFVCKLRGCERVCYDSLFRQTAAFLMKPQVKCFKWTRPSPRQCGGRGGGCHAVPEYELSVCGKNESLCTKWSCAFCRYWSCLTKKKKKSRYLKI